MRRHPRGGGPVRGKLYRPVPEAHAGTGIILFRIKNITARGQPRRFPKGDRKALWSRPQARNLCLWQSNCLCDTVLFLNHILICSKKISPLRKFFCQGGNASHISEKHSSIATAAYLSKYRNPTKQISFHQLPTRCAWNNPRCYAHLLFGFSR